MVVFWPAPSQCWNVVKWTLRNKLQWNLNRNTHIFIQENALENIVWKMAAILSWSQCVKGCSHIDVLPILKWTSPTTTQDRSMGQCKKEVTPLLTHWGYVSVALTHRDKIVLSSHIYQNWWAVEIERTGSSCHNKAQFHQCHDDVIKWRHFPRYWPFVRGIHRSTVNPPPPPPPPAPTHPPKDQWRGALWFSLICAWTNAWANNRGVGDLRRHRAHYDITLMRVYTYMILRWCCGIFHGQQTQQTMTVCTYFNQDLSH